jgi:hypothetical protein
MWANIGSVCWRERRGRRTVAVTCNMRQYQLMRTTADVVACGADIAGIAAHLAVRFLISIEFSVREPSGNTVGFAQFG